MNQAFRLELAPLRLCGWRRCHGDRSAVEEVGPGPLRLRLEEELDDRAAVLAHQALREHDVQAVRRALPPDVGRGAEHAGRPDTALEQPRRAGDAAHACHPVRWPVSYTHLTLPT